VKTIDGEVRQRRLDHCFVGGMFADRVRYVTADIGEIASDHFPVRIDIDLETPVPATSFGGR
jgi:endonuclease/exonuclease/phosphatase family metal-dependent hydrolase